MDFEISKIAREAFDDALKARGHVNVLVAGRTGVGKSSLINAVFGEDFAKTGQGKPVTQGMPRPYTRPGSPLTIWDSTGLELGEKEFTETNKLLVNFVTERKNSPDPNSHIHVAWLCIDEGSRRVQAAEQKWCTDLAKVLPVVVVITKAMADAGFHEVAKSSLPEAKSVVRVNSVGMALDSNHRVQVHGIKELVEVTRDLVAEGQRRAFVAAQKASLDLKVRECNGIISAAAMAAGTAAAAPIPFSDAFLLVPIQIGMIAKISSTFGLEQSEGFLSTIVASAIGGTTATLAGRFIVTNALKFIPGLGSAAGGILAAGTAATLTTAMGKAYVTTLATLFQETNGATPTAEQIAERFRRQLGA
jgi:uncharacterized protein (DUF697 family)/GTP-binding protein EngB required for normal cell division